MIDIELLMKVLKSYLDALKFSPNEEAEKELMKIFECLEETEKFDKEMLISFLDKFPAPPIINCFINVHEGKEVGIGIIYLKSLSLKEKIDISRMIIEALLNDPSIDVKSELFDKIHKICPTSKGMH
jgi:hypothetical protein